MQNPLTAWLSVQCKASSCAGIASCFKRKYDAPYIICAGPFIIRIPSRGHSNEIEFNWIELILPELHFFASLRRLYNQVKPVYSAMLLWDPIFTMTLRVERWNASSLSSLKDDWSRFRGQTHPSRGKGCHAGNMGTLQGHHPNSVTGCHFHLLPSSFYCSCSQSCFVCLHCLNPCFSVFIFPPIFHPPHISCFALCVGAGHCRLRALWSHEQDLLPRGQGRHRVLRWETPTLSLSFSRPCFVLYTRWISIPVATVHWLGWLI